MPESDLTIQRALSSPFSTGSSFEAEERAQLWRRCRLLFLTGLVVSVIALVLEILVPRPERSVMSPLVEYERYTGAIAHGLSLLAGLGLLQLVRERRRYVSGIAFSVVAFNIVLAIYNEVAYRPLHEPYFAVSLALFLSAAFLPWRSTYQVSLAVLATFALLVIGFLLYHTVVEYQGFWLSRGGAAAARSHTIWTATSVAILGGASVFVSQTLYSLRRTAHRAQRLGNYLIHRELGGGGMGRVYLAQHSLMCRPTAVKVMGAEEGGQQAALARFEREIKLSATLTHPNTITIYDVGWTPERNLYYAMEYLEGLDLQEFVERFGPLEPARAVYVLVQACGSLAEAHTRGIVHRDIKPSNIFLTRRGGLYDFVKVLDFGLAKQINGDRGTATVTKSGILFGTPRYLAPEMVYGMGNIDARADIYCLGGVAYWMLTGQPPFTARSSMEVVIDHVKTRPRPPSQVSELAISGALDEIVLKCLEKKPEDRFQSALELERALIALSFEEPWVRERAEDWWRLHGVIAEDRDCECFFPDEEEAAEPRVNLVVAQPTA
jgi:hypothetical protein